MKTKYIIDGTTLTDIANSIRTMEGHTDPVPVEEFADRIGGIEPTIEEYIRLFDYTKYPIQLNELDYNIDEINECKKLIEFYSEMEVKNGK